MKNNAKGNEYTQGWETYPRNQSLLESASKSMYKMQSSANAMGNTVHDSNLGRKVLGTWELGYDKITKKKTNDLANVALVELRKKK